MLWRVHSRIYESGSYLARWYPNESPFSIYKILLFYRCNDRGAHLLRPFLTRKFFREILGLEGSKLSWKKNNFLEKFPRPKFPQEISARILPAEEILKPKISWRRENFTRKFLDHLIIELKSVPFPSTG